MNNKNDMKRLLRTICCVGTLGFLGFGATAQDQTVNGDLKVTNNSSSDREIWMSQQSGAMGRVLLRQVSTNDIYFGDVDNFGGKVHIRANGQTHFSLLENGFVGIGAMNPASKLEISSNNHQLRITDNDNANKFWTLSSVQSNDGIGLFENAASGRFVVASGGNVGIGTDAPGRLMHLKSPGPYLRMEMDPGKFSMIEMYEATNRVAGIHWLGHQTPNRLSLMTGVTDIAERLSITEDGKVGIGTTNPQAQFDIHRTGTIGSQWRPEHAQLQLSDGTVSMIMDGNEMITNNLMYFGAKDGFRFRTVNGTSMSELIVIKSDGNVGIGVVDPGSKLDVNGTMRAEEVKVEVVNGPDYVFEEDYNLRSLEETKAYIEENKHLPEIPSAAEMETEGIGLADMNMRLLKKIEELTLHIIAQQEQIDDLKKTMMNQKDQEE